MITRRRSTAIILLATALSLAACSRPAVQPPGVAAAPATPLMAMTPVPATTPAPHRPVSIPAELQGTWQAVVTGTTASSGAWTLKGTADDLLLHNPVGAADDFFSVDAIAITPTTLTLAVSADCPDQAAATEGNYTWAITGGKLVFKLVNDSCGDRAGILTKTPWTKAP
jgi:hypothetical protein